MMVDREEEFLTSGVSGRATAAVVVGRAEVALAAKASDARSDGGATGASG